MERRVWQRTKQAAQATARFVKYLPLAASLMLYACGSCQTSQKGVGKMGDGNTELLKKDEDPKKKVTVSDSLKTKPDSLTAKNDSLARADSLIKRIIQIREENIKLGINPIRPEDRKPKIIR